MITIYQLLKNLENTSSRKEKESILLKFDYNVELFKEIINYTYDKIFKNFFLKKIPTLNNDYGKLSLEQNPTWMIVKEFLNSLMNRDVTGTQAINAFRDVLNLLDNESREILIKIVSRDLKVGISESTILNIWPNIIPTFDVALCNKYDDKTKKNVDDSYFISQKLDGVRTVIIVDKIVNNSVKSFGRSGKEFSTLSNVENELFKMCKPNTVTVFDGEVCIMNSNGQEDFQSIMKEIKRKDHTIEHPKYVIFDCLTGDEFYGLEESRTFSKRLEDLVDLVINYNNALSYNAVLPQLQYSEQNFKVMKDLVVQNNWEGLILRKNNKYQSGRSNDLLKVKEFFDEEFIVIDLETGPFTKTVAGKGQETIECVTTIYIEYKGNRVGVGSGMSVDQRIEWFKDPSKIVGKTVTVKYFEVTKNQDNTESLRFPTLKTVHGDIRDV